MTNEHFGDARSVVQAGVVYGGIRVEQGGKSEVKPAELPAEPALFVDRESERALLDAVLERAGTSARARVVVISGPSGSGKSALATHWLCQVLSRFADGQVYFDFHARGGEVELAEVVDHCLRAMGVDGDGIPASPERAMSLLRTSTNGRRLVFLFDNAPAAAELLRLQLNSSEIVILVTSQHTGLGLEGVDSVELGALAAEPALRLLAEACRQDRVVREPAAAARIVELCAGMPIALRVVAGQLSIRPKWTLSRVVERLEDENLRLDRLTDQGNSVVRSALEFAYSQLAESEAWLYCLLGVIPGYSFSPEAVAALAELSRDDAEDGLENLRAVSLLECDDHDQYRFHDLVRLHSRSMTVADRDSALARLVGWYREWGAFADRAVMGPDRLRVSQDDVAGRDNPFDHDQALVWLERERTNLLAIVDESYQRNWNHAVISLCDSPLWTLHNRHKHYRDTMGALEKAVAAARQDKNVVAEARMRTLVVRLRMECHEFELAHEQAELARQLAADSGHRRILASAIEFHGKVYLEQKSWSAAIPLFEQARSINAELAKPRGMALQEHFLGQAQSGIGEHENALHTLETALRRIADYPGDRRTPARIRVSMGRVHQELGRHSEAIEVLRIVLSDMTAAGASFDLGKPLELLADSHAARGDQDRARECRAQALSIYEQSNSPEADRLRSGDV